LALRTEHRKKVRAWCLRERTTVTWRWAAGKLEMGHYTRVTPTVSRLRRKPGRKSEKLKQKRLESENDNAGK